MEGGGREGLKRVSGTVVADCMWLGTLLGAGVMGLGAEFEDGAEMGVEPEEES